MYICMYVHVYAHVYVNMHLCMYVCALVYLLACLFEDGVSGFLGVPHLGGSPHSGACGGWLETPSKVYMIRIGPGCRALGVGVLGFREVYMRLFGSGCQQGSFQILGRIHWFRDKGHIWV